MKFHIQTWGCQMNDHDGEKLSGLLSADGFEAVDSAEEAELVLLNTCSIREKAVHKVYSELGRLREEKQRRPLLVGVTGCLAQQEQAALFKRAPHIDFVLGTMALRQLPRLVAEARAGRIRVMDTDEYPDNHLFPPSVTRRRRTVDMHIARLREKLRDDAEEPAVLLTVRGKGYMFRTGRAGN